MARCTSWLTPPSLAQVATWGTSILANARQRGPAPSTRDDRATLCQARLPDQGRPPLTAARRLRLRRPHLWMRPSQRRARPSCLRWSRRQNPLRQPGRLDWLEVSCPVRPVLYCSCRRRRQRSGRRWASQRRQQYPRCRGTRCPLCSQGSRRLTRGLRYRSRPAAREALRLWRLSSASREVPDRGPHMNQRSSQPGSPRTSA